jgi:hypothetical protein
MTPPPVQFQYDSDFSECSTPGASDTENQFPLIRRIPEYCLVPPHIPNGRFTWNCQGCSYHIDLLNLSHENLRNLPNDAILLLTGKSWNIHDDPVQHALSLMVSKHYTDVHVEHNRVGLIQTGSTWHLKDVLPPNPRMKVEEDIHDATNSIRRSSRIPVPRRTSSSG